MAFPYLLCWKTDGRNGKGRPKKNCEIDIHWDTHENDNLEGKWIIAVMEENISHIA